MNKIVSFIKKPKNVYFSIVALLTVVAGLASVSFSYYVPDTNINADLELPKVDTRIQSDDLEEGIMYIASGDTIDISVNVINNNDFDTKFKLIYESIPGIDAYVYQEENEVISSHEVRKIDLMISNTSEENGEIKIDLISGYINNELDSVDNEVTVVEKGN